MSRRSSLILAAAIVAVSMAAAEDQFVDPPGEETQAVASAIAGVERALSEGASISAVLSDPALLDLHPYPRFRDAIRRFGKSPEATIVGVQEAGPRLHVVGIVKDAEGRNIAGARVYAYQTSAAGWYAATAAHFRSNSGDTRHARLFGYVTTDASGRFEIRTVRPAGYPGSDLPAHIHVQIAKPGEERDSLVTEILFEDDPRLTPQARERSKREGFVIVPVEHEGDSQHVSATFTLR